MGSISNYLENKFLNHILKSAEFTASGTLYVGLSSTIVDDTEDGNINEPENTYARETIAFNAPTSSTVVQNGDITFNRVSGTWGTDTNWSWFICDHLDNTAWGTDVNIYAYGSLTSGTIYRGDIPTISGTKIQVSIDAGGTSEYLKEKFLSLAFRGGTFAPPTNLYVALCDTTVTDYDNGTSISEIGMINYLREQHNSWNAVTGTTPTLVDNNGIIDFGQLFTTSAIEGTGETIKAICLCDDPTTGQMLFYDNVSPQFVKYRDYVNIPSGAFDIKIS